MERKNDGTLPFAMSETSLGRELKRRRGKRPLREVAEGSGISIATLSRIEADLIELPGKDTLAAISRGYGLPLEMLAQLVYLGRPSPDADAASPTDEASPADSKGEEWPQPGATLRRPTPAIS